MAEDKVTNLYNAFVKSGYAMEPETQFRENLKDPKKRKAAYDALVADGYSMEPFADFESNIGFGAPAPTTPASQQQAQPATTAAPTSVPASATAEEQEQAPAQSQLEQPAWQPSEQDKIRMSYQMNTMLNDFNQRSRARLKQIHRLTEPFSPNGRLTTSLFDTYSARRTRATSINAQIKQAETELAGLQKQYEDSKSRVHEELAEDYKKNTAPLAAVFASHTYVSRQQTDKENSALRVAIRQKEEQIKDLIEERDRQSGKDVGFWRGFGRTVSDFRTWDFGMNDLSDAMTMLNAERYFSPNATEGERKAREAMMKAIYDKQETENLYSGNASWWNRAGGMTGHMPAFMLDFAFTGGGYGSIAKVGANTAVKQSVKIFGKKAIEEMAELGVKGYAKKYGVRGVGKMAGNWTVKALGTTADDLLVRAPLMTNTIQGGKTAADIIDRKFGDVVIDKNGNYDFSNDKTWGSAIWQGEANSIIENYSEMFGSHIDSLTPMLAKTFGSKRISGMLARANASGLGQILDTTRKQLQHLGVSDFFGEVSEEYYGQLWRTMLNLDDAYTNVLVFDAHGNPMIDEHGDPVTERKNLLFTSQFHGDIWGGMALSMGLIGAGKYTLTGVGYANMKREVNKADRTASQILNHDEWETLRETIDNTTNEDMGALAENIINDSKLSEEERAVVMEYMERSLNLRGLNLATLAQNRGAETDEPVTLEDVYLPDHHTDGETSSHFTPEQADAQQLYSKGRELYGRFEEGDPTVQADVDAIALRMKEAYQAVEDAFGSEAEYYMFHVNENPWALVNDPELTAEQQDAVLYCINAKAALDGVMDASNDAADRKRAEVEQSVAKRTHKDNGIIIPATMKVDDRQVYVVKGDVVMFPDGSAVDVRNSSESVVVMDAQTGEYEFTSPDQIFKVSEAVNPQDELDTALSVIEQEQMSVFGQNAVAPEEPAEGEAPIDQSADVSPEPAHETASTEEYDRGYEQGLEEAAKADDAWIANLIKIYSQNTPESMPETMKGRLDAFLYEQQRRAQSVPETPENVPNPTENAVSDAEIAPETVSSVENGQQTALSRIPLNEQGEPRFEAVDKDTAWDGLVEAVGGETDAVDIAMAQIQQASTDLEALKKKPPTLKAPKLKGSPMAMAQAKREAAEQYQRDLAQYNQQIADTEARLATWNGIVGVYTSRNAELRRQQEEERRQRDAIAHDEAVARFEEEQRIKAEKQAEQERIGVHAVNPKIKAKWAGAPKIEGHTDAITLPDGSIVRGRYVMTEAGAASTSHDVNNAYMPTEGFPVDENGQSVNDRDYMRDTDAQRIVEQIAGSYDNRALQTPVIVSKDGVVLSGNNRTMSGDLAARQGTDKAYVDYLREFGHKYGFTPEQVQGMSNPRLVFVPEEDMPYDATTFSRFNAQEMKSQSKPEAAVKLGKIVPDNVFTDIVGDISKYDRLSDYYADEKAVAHALGALMQAGVINDKQLPEMRTGTTLSVAGKELIENTLIGKVFQTSPDAVRQIISMPTLRQSIVMGLNEIANNRTLARNGYDISEELAKAVDLVTHAKNTMPDVYTDGMPVSPFGRMQGLFDDEFGDSRVADATALLLADILNSGKPSDLRKVLTSYNNEAAQASGGQLDMFSGSIPSKEEILTNVNEHFRNATPKEQQALVEAAIAERKRRAEAEQLGRDQESEQTPNDVERSAEPQQPVAGTREELTPEEQALAARVEITENDWEEGDSDKPTYKREIIIDGTHIVTQVDAPNEDGHYTGSYFEFDGKRFGDIAEIAQYIDGHPSAELKVDGGMQSEPTEAQKAAGNYKMEHRKVDGYNVSIENAKGSVRRGTGADGKSWETTMQNDYGYIRGTQGVDGDHIDVFLSDTPEEGDVFVVDQVNEDGSFDEHKVMYGFPTEQAARDAYLSNYEQGWTGLGAITHVSKEEFKKWIGSSKRKTKPFANYKSVKPKEDNSMVGRSLSEQEATELIARMEATAEVAPTIELTPENWIAQFGEDGTVETPIGIVKMGANQLLKLYSTKRTGYFGMIHPTLSTPDVILEEADPKEGSERDSKYLFIKTFVKSDGTRIVHFESVTVKKDGMEVSISSHEIKDKSLKNKMQNDIVLHLDEKLSPSSEMRLTEAPSESEGPDLVPTSDNVISSDRKDNTLSADKQAESAESSEPYTITPTTYTNKKGKTSDVHLVKFNRELTAEEKAALDTFVREPLAEGKKTSRGWYDRKQGGYMMRSEEAARQLGEMLGNEEAVADVQPMTAEELREAVGASRTRNPRPKKSPINRVSLEDVMTDLSTKGETKLSDHAEPVKAEQEAQHEISDDEMQWLANELRELLGIGEDEGDADIKFRDPGELTPQERQRIQSAGIRLAMGLVERDTTSFPDYATKMVGLLGDKIRPWLKSFYEGARWTPGYEKYAFTPTEQVAVFDVQNFDKKQADPIAQAAMIVEERKAATASEQAQKELIETRNKNRRENDKQREADTAALAEKAEAVAGEAEVTAQSAGTGEAGRKRILRDLKRVDDTLDEVNDQLAILGYYEAEEVDKDFNEAYGYMRNAEKKAVKDAVELAKQLVNDLGLGLDKVTGSTTANRGKRKNAVTANIAPAGGDISIRLPLNEGRELYITIGLDPSVTPGDVTYSGDNLQATRIMYRVEWPDEKGHVSFDRMGRNCWADANVTYADLLKGIQREAKEYLPSSTPAEAEETHNGYKIGDEVMWDRYGNGNWEKVKIEDFDTDGGPIFEAVKGVMSEKGDWSRVKPADGIFGEAKRVARATQEKKRSSRKKDVTLKPEQPFGDLFGGLFDNTQSLSNHEETEMGTRPGEAGRQRQQLKQDTQVGGDEPRRETERPAGEAGSGSTGMDSDADRAGSRGLHDVATQPALERLPEKERKNVHNNHVERGTEVAPKSESARIKANIAAIETMKKLEASGEAVRQTLRSLEDSKAYNGTVAIFADNYQRKNKGTGAVEFNLFDDIRTKLIAQGVPAEQVVIMRDGMTDKAKEKIFAKVNAGEIRVILGTTQRLGVGVNIQERLHTLMHIDAPNRPMDYWQRMGRLLRQGNMHKEMGIPVRVIRFGVEDSLDVTAYQRLKTKGAIADAIMHSKDLLANNLENRILEEEGDEFGNITAELSGSQYAMLQNQTEKELRKLQAKQDQHRQHQMYIHRAEPRLREQIEKFGNDIMRSNEILALLENNPTTITINGKTYQSREDMQKVFEAHNKAMAAKKQSVQQDEPITSTLTFDIGNVHFTLTTHVSQIAGYGGQGPLSFDVDVQHDVVSHDIDYKRSFGDIPLKRIINELVDSVTSGKEERSNREAWVNAKERNETDLAALLKDKGKPFEHGERIKELEQKLEEYTIAMQEELKEKEAKYAEMDANIEDATDITFTSEDDEDSEDTPTNGDGNKYREDDDIDYSTLSDSNPMAMEARISELSKKVHTPVRIIRSLEELNEITSHRKRNAKGWWSAKDNEVVIVLPNNVNVADVDNTFVHEVAGHKGLRAFIGEERFNEFLGEVYNHASNPIRKVIDKKTDDMVNAEADRLRVRKAQARERAGEDVNSSYYADMAEARVEAEAKREEFRKEATEEYMSELGGRIGSEGFEKMSRDELTLWGKIKAKVQSFLDKFLRGLKIAKSIRLNDKDLSYILYKSWKNLRDKQGKGGVFAEAEDVVMRRRTGYDADDVTRFRDPGLGLEETITKMKAEALQANTDNLQAKRDAMRAIGGNLNHLRQAMARQREYDITTVKSVADLARILMDANLLDDLSKYETKRILGAINNVVGKQDVSRYVQKVMDIMVDNQLRMGANTLGRLLSIRGSHVDARGIEVQGELDPDGQRIAQVVRKATSLPKDNIDIRIAEAINRMSSTDQAIADDATIEYAGLQIARQYVEDITESKAEEKALRDSIKQAKEDKDAGQMTEDAYRQYVASTEDAIRQNKIERAEAFHSLVEQVGGVLNESVERAKAWREAEKQRVEEIHHNANSDMEGRPTDEHHKDDRTQKLVNNSGVRFLLAPLATFDQMLRMFGKKNTRGEGYLWNRYMRGWVSATEKEYTGYRDALKVLDAKVSEIYGKDMKWGDLFSIDRKLPKASVRFFDGGEMKDHELTQGNLLYIYMADKMSDGRMKLRRMGITEEDIEDIKNFLDPKFIQLADWMQEEFLVDKRNEYNEVHKRMFGASMAAIENYFPLKILANARLENVDVADDTTDTALPATSTGSIIKRRRNNLALDVTGANAFSVILDHLQQMERWAAFAEFNRDLNTLLSYKRFRNQVMNMSSVYGGGKTLWNNVRNVCRMAAGAYRPPIAALDKSAVNIAKGVTAAKVSFRVFTALKQFLSMPAYISDSNPMYLAANIANPIGAWRWSMKNLPLFEKRWSSRMAGDPRLLKSDMDWKMWRSRIVEIASRVGMSPNAFVDALTVAIGSHSMYQTKLAKYKRQGYAHDVAEARAKQDATILFNQTQQSSEGAFLSTMQVDRSWLSVLFTVFRNSSMSYTRQLYDSIRNLGHRFTPGYKGLSEEFMAKQMRRDGIDPDKADRNAKQEYRRGIIRDLVRVGVFGYVLQLAWNLGAYLPYLILGEDDEEKDKMWQDVWNHSMFGSIEGLTGGDVISAAGNMWVSGEGNPQYLTKDMPLASDVLSILKKMDKDQVSAMNDVINLLVQSTVGVNPQSLTDAVVAVMDYCGDDAETSRECALLMARVLNCPQSQLDKIYFDELDASGEEASQMTPSEIAERYARYKVRRGAPLTGWAYGNEQREKLMDKYRDRSNTLAKERLTRETDKQASQNMAQWLEEFEATKDRVKEIRKVKSRDEDRYDELLNELEITPEYDRYEIIKGYKRDVDALTKEWLNATTPAQRDSCAQAIIRLKSDMVRELINTQQ